MQIKSILYKVGCIIPWLNSLLVCMFILFSASKSGKPEAEESLALRTLVTFGKSNAVDEGDRADKEPLGSRCDNDLHLGVLGDASAELVLTSFSNTEAESCMISEVVLSHLGDLGAADDDSWPVADTSPSEGCFRSEIEGILDCAIKYASKDIPALKYEVNIEISASMILNLYNYYNGVAKINYH